MLLAIPFRMSEAGLGDSEGGLDVRHSLPMRTDLLDRRYRLRGCLEVEQMRPVGSHWAV